MKITYISPPFGEGGQKSKGLPIAPPVLEYLAGLTKQVDDQFEVALIDANLEDLKAEELQTDVVGITILTPQAPWAYKTAKVLRDKGIKVIFGGMHPSILPDEAKQFADSIVTGEAEPIIAQLLQDIKDDNLKELYEGGHPSLENLPRPLTKLLRGKYHLGSFFTARGCLHKCAFCSVHKFFGGNIRYRPIDEVVGEVAASKWRMFWNIDDNGWGHDIKRATELYKEMSKNVRNKWWFASSDLATVQRPNSQEMLKRAREAGLTAVLVGWESCNEESLREYNAKQKQGIDRLEAIKKIRAAGIDVMLFVTVGGRQESLEDYHRILEFCDKHSISAHPTMITPFPGTDLYELYREHLFEDLKWDMFDGNRALFKHDDQQMSVSNREEALLWLRAELFKLPKIFKRISKISLKGFPMAHMTSFMIQYPQGRAFKEFAAERNISADLINKIKYNKDY